MFYVCVVNKKESIIKAAIALLAKKGVHNTPMSEIAKVAGTGMGTIYNHFPNKDVLINEIYLLIKEKEEAIFLRVDTTKFIKIQFENYLKTLIDFFIENPNYYSFLKQLEASPIITEENRAKGKKSVDMVAILLAKGQDEGIVKPIDMGEILMFIGGAVSGCIRGILTNGLLEKPSIERQILMIWDGIKQ